MGEDEDVTEQTAAAGEATALDDGPIDEAVDAPADATAGDVDAAPEPVRTIPVPSAESVADEPAALAPAPEPAALAAAASGPAEPSRTLAQQRRAETAAVGGPEYLTYEEFGRAFFEVAVTSERLGTALGALAGEAFRVGPLPAGPGGVVKVRADVQISEPEITRHVAELITFSVKLPLTISLLIDLKLDRIHYDVTGLIVLPLTVRCAKPLELRIEVPPPTPADVIVDVSSRNMRGEIIRNLAQVDAEIRRVIAKTVAEEIDKPEARKARFIDVSAELSRALEGEA